MSLLVNLPIFFPTGSVPWLIVNFSWDIILGTGAFILLVYLVPRIQKFALKYGDYPDKKGVIRQRPVHPRIFRYYAFFQIITLVVVLWGIFLTLVFSVGWKAPTSLPNIWFDLIYARANGEPNGAHIFSWLSCAGFGLAVWFKTIPRPAKTFHDILGDPFQGIAGLIFIGGVHELLWIGPYYVAYAQYLSWSMAYEVLRDVSFGVMMVLFIMAFVKSPTRPFPLKILKPMVAFYCVYLAAWFVVPALFGYHLLPITTLNNPNFGVGLYQETPWFSWWWINAIEENGWIVLCVPAIIAVLRYKKPNPTRV